jgi:hypothetical protein
MPWAIAVSFVVGAVCAVRLPVLLFTIVVALVVVVFAVTSHSIGNSVGSSALWALAYAAALEAGYVFSHCLFYLAYVRRSSQASKADSSEMRSKYSAD